jgi:hypothetical protein
MTVVARPASVGLWLDTDAKLTTPQLEALIAAAHPVGVIRTLPLPGLGPEIERDELERILGMGLELMLYQRVRFPGWDPRAHSGSADGAAAAHAALDAGYPAAAHIFLDLEGIKGDAEGTIGFADLHADQILESGFRAGVYVGYEVPLTPEQLYENLPQNSYWSDAGHRSVAIRGCALHQGKQVTIGGVDYDFDELRPDLLGGVPFAAVAT